MSSFKLVAIVFAVFAALSAHDVRAQDAPSGAAAPAGPRDPGDPKAAVPAATYTSAFRRYRPNADVEVGPWRDLNEGVGRIGGWRVYGREASPTGAGKPDAAPPAAAPVHGHKHQEGR